MKGLTKIGRLKDCGKKVDCHMNEEYMYFKEVVIGSAKDACDVIRLGKKEEME